MNRRGFLHGSAGGVSGAKVNSPLKAGPETSLPVQMALSSHGSQKTVSQAQLL
jgi:hypothetical protein